MLTDKEREDAKRFLQDLRLHLNQVPAPKIVRSWIDEHKKSAKNVEFEGAFLSEHVLPLVSEYLRQVRGLTQEQIQTALLAESRSFRKGVTGWLSPISKDKYLFTKEFGVASTSLTKSWWNKDGKSPVAQSCPDFAFQEPCPKVVFEAKLFRRGGPEAAKAELVRAIYQCMFYRSHPSVPATKRHAKWDYDFACLLAYDASEAQSMVEAWRTVRHDVQNSCWDSANIFVMVLP